jgi:rubredoxin
MAIPSKFKCLDPEITKKLIEGQEDILGPAVKSREELYRNAICPSCGESNFKMLPKKLNAEELVPYHYMECRICGCVFDPKTGIILKDGVQNIKSELAL